MQNQLQKAINIVKKTGDRLIVFDSREPENVYVIMALNDYENLVIGRSEVRGLTEDELLDKINRDIAIWKSDQNYNNNSSDLAEYASQKENSESDFDFENMDIKNIIDRHYKKERKPLPAWSIPDRVKQNAEEIIEEDRQYLEDVPF